MLRSKAFIILLFVLFASPALAQSGCGGQFLGGTLCGNNGSVQGIPSPTANPVLGVSGTNTGTLSFAGATSGEAILTPQSAAGTPILTLPTTTGTLASSASSPLVLNTVTGVLTCPTCVTGTSGALANGVTPTSGYSNTQILSSNGSVLSAYSVSGTGEVALTTSPLFTTPQLLGSSTGFTTFTSNNAGASNYTATFPANTGTISELNLAQTWTAIQTFTNSDIVLLGSSTGGTTFTSANAGASNYTATFPANTGTISELNLAQTWTAAQTFTNSDILLLGSSTGFTTFSSANASGTNYTITFPAATGTVALTSGANVASVSNSDGTLTVSPTTGAVVASLNVNHANTWTAIQTFTNSDIVLLGSSTGATTFTSANASGTNYTITIPANTGTLAELNIAQVFTAAQTVQSASASAFAVGLNGATNPAFVVNASTASQAAGLSVTGAASGGTVAVATIDSSASNNLTINAKGSGTIGIGSVSTGAVTITPATTITGALTEASIYGGSAAGSTLALISTSNGSPSGDEITLSAGGSVIATVNSTGLGIGGAPTNPLTITNTTTATSSAPSMAHLTQTINPGSASTATTFGIYIASNYTSNFSSSNNYNIALETDLNNNGTGTLAIAYGATTNAQNSSTGTITFAIGSEGSATNNSTGTINNAWGVWGQANNLAVSTMTTAYSFYGNISNLGGGTITSAAALFITTPTGATVGNTSIWTNTYGAYFQDQSPSGAGTNTLTNPPEALHIASQTAAGAYAIHQVGSGLNSFAGATTFSGAVTFSSSVKVSNLAVSATAPTFTSGACTGAIGTVNGTAAFTFTTGSSSCGSTATIGMPTATTGWICDALDMAEAGTARIQETSNSTTSVVFTNYSIGSSPAAANFTASHTVLVKCMAY